MARQPKKDLRVDYITRLRRMQKIERDMVNIAAKFAVIIDEVSDMNKPMQKKKKLKEFASVIEDESILDYQRCRIGAALPWDHARHAVHAPWAKLSEDVGPRDSGRGIRSGI